MFFGMGVYHAMMSICVLFVACVLATSAVYHKSYVIYVTGLLLVVECSTLYGMPI